MNALRLTTQAEDERLVIELPERLRGKKLTVLISEKPVIKKVSAEEYRRRLEALRSVQHKGPIVYQATVDEWYEQ